MYKWIFFLTLHISVTAVFSQENKQEEESLKGAHSFALMICHSHVLNGVGENGEKQWLVLPSWGFDYNYWFSNRWAVGLQADIITETFEVEQHGGGNTVERSKPWALLSGLSFKPEKHSIFCISTGGEFAKEGNFFLTRFKYEFGWELSGNWELAPFICYDIKWNGYDTWTIGLGIAKIFRRK